MWRGFFLGTAGRRWSGVTGVANHRSLKRNAASFAKVTGRMLPDTAKAMLKAAKGS